MKTITIKQGDSLNLLDLAKFIKLGLVETRLIVEKGINVGSESFGLQSLLISYHSTQRAYILKTGSTIGILEFENFKIEIKPKFEFLTVAQCLKILAYLDSLSLAKTANHTLLSSVDYETNNSDLGFFAYSLCTKVFTYLEIGSSQTYETKLIHSSSLEGPIDFSETINRGQIKSPVVHKSFLSINSPENRFLKRALSLVSKEISNEKIRLFAFQLLERMEEVSEDQTEFTYETISLIERRELRETMLCAYAVNYGIALDNEGKQGFFPPFLIDLDSFFEKIAYFMLKEVTKPETALVIPQKCKRIGLSNSNSMKNIYIDIFYQAQGPNTLPIVVDTKNKFSSTTAKEFSIKNEDIYQMYFYMKEIGSFWSILVYPGDLKDSSSFPLQESTGKEAYDKRVKEKLHRMYQSGQLMQFDHHNDKQKTLGVIIWRVGISNSIDNLRKNIEELSNLMFLLSTTYQSPSSLQLSN